MSAQFDRMSAIEMKRRIARKEMSPVDVTKRALDAAQATQKTLNCYSTLMPEAALAAAQAAEDAIMKKQPLGLLHGLPVSVKDLIAVGGVTYARSKSVV